LRRGAGVNQSDEFVVDTDVEVLVAVAVEVDVEVFVVVGVNVGVEVFVAGGFACHLGDAP